MHHACFVSVKLHEHVVPNFDKAVAIFIWAAWRAAWNMVAMIVKNLRTRAARASVTHHPEVITCVARAFVIANAHNALGRYAYFFIPDVISFVIICINRNC